MRGVSLRRALALAALFSAGVASAGELQVSVSQTYRPARKKSGRKSAALAS